MKNQNTYLLIPIIMLGLFIVVFWGCSKEGLATLTTLAATEITANSAKSGGIISSDGGGEITERGLVWAAHENPSVEQHSGITQEGAGPGQFTSGLTNLLTATTYYARAYAVNGAGTAYGNLVIFTTFSPPVANFSGNPTSGNAPLTVIFTDQSGNYPTSWNWDFGDGATSTNQNPSHTYNDPGNYTVQLTVTSAYGSDTETKTAYIDVSEAQNETTGTFTDIRDDQTYKWVKIGNQVWMAENLKYLPSVNEIRPEGPGMSATIPNYTVFGYLGTDVEDAKNRPNYRNYGVLYNWPAAVDACPPGWHLPSHIEWLQLERYVCNQLGNSDCGTIFPYNLPIWRFGTTEGRALKSCRQVLAPSGGECNTFAHPRWNSSGYDYGTDEFGFSAFPGGIIDTSGTGLALGAYGAWWSATEHSAQNAWGRQLNVDRGSVNRYFYEKSYGYSIRCVKD